MLTVNSVIYDLGWNVISMSIVARGGEVARCGGKLMKSRGSRCGSGGSDK